MKWKIDLQEVKDLLGRAELKELQAEIATKCNGSVVPLQSVKRLWAELSVSDMSKEDFIGVLNTGRHELIEMAKSLDALESTHEGEFPSGEEEEGVSLVRELGFVDGFGLTYSVYLFYLGRNDLVGLLGYLRRRGIPAPKKFLDQLISIYNNIKRKGVSP
jgi:hypothetical protein